MNLPQIPLCILDTETTGFVPKVNKVIEFASVRIEGGEVVDRYEELLSIPTDIPAVVEMITRIKTDDLSGKPTFEERHDEILSHIGPDTVIVGQNIGYDLGMLKGEGMDLSDRPWIDTSMLASLVYPELESYSLPFMSAVLNLNHTPKHRAMGDVVATMELLSLCYERLQQLPDEMMAQAKDVMGKSSEGYRMLFESLEGTGASAVPQWLSGPVLRQAQDDMGSGPKQFPGPGPGPGCKISMEKPDAGTVQLLEEPLDPGTLQSLIREAAKDTSTTQWIAVKNLEATVKRLSVPEGVRILHPPFQLIDQEAKEKLMSQDVFTADEATLALKLLWYAPQTQDDFPIHGDERSVWTGKLACTEESQTYLKQFEDLPSVMLLDHRQLLSFLADSDHCGHEALTPDAHVIIDDASMLEDTATKAYGWSCDLDALRAAAQGDTQLTKFVDVVFLFFERIRSDQDIRYLVEPDLTTPEAKGLREQLAALLQDAQYDGSIRKHLSNLVSILDPQKLSGRIAYVEHTYRGTLYVTSVPEAVGIFLREHLYDSIPTTLLIPPGSAQTLTEVLPQGQDVLTDETLESGSPLSISFPEELGFQKILSDPPDGKTIILANSKRMIEDAFIKHTIPLEERGVELICQGLSGGMGRSRATFMAASSPAIWIQTPWAFEGVDLPPGEADRLVILTMPFDHPSHAILSRRAEHFRDAFSQYSLPRMKHRLFRLLRTFAKFASGDGEVLILDERLKTKKYGKEVRSYLEGLSRE